ncbi:MAG: DUF4390 domain-containing protein [Gammaproteobacteria bacterium]|nr:DUF4390 domain-containing protein [Gammaproteobacteria bacterium]MBU1656325.1 DUF4390 domain-containing protein [Gammaproteobacteria bacterium]MBU1959890.1 DUF4390 domain-containing protein [Gammaproteobacteria bacterium]
MIRAASFKLIDSPPHGGKGAFPALSRWLSVLLLASLSAVAAADGIEVESLSSRLQEGVYLLDAQILYQPSKAILDALEHGVSLTFETRLEVLRKDAWIWERSIAKHRLRYQLRYHALVSRYELFLPDKRSLRFATLEGALRALGEMADVAIVKESALEVGQEYQLRLGVKLDIESLPVPLRPRAYLSSDWSLSYEPRTWPLVR